MLIIFVVSCFLIWFQPVVFVYMCCLGAVIGMLSAITRQRITADSLAVNSISQRLVLMVKETIGGLREIRTSSLETKVKHSLICSMINFEPLKRDCNFFQPCRV